MCVCVCVCACVCVCVCVCVHWCVSLSNFFSLLSYYMKCTMAGLAVFCLLINKDFTVIKYIVKYT